jgi:2-hydroxy-6-oxonona-2,4-dienedioate hydrolase
MLIPHEIFEGPQHRTLVFLPGLFAGKWIWKEQLTFFHSAGYRVLSFSDAFIKVERRLGSFSDLCSICEDVIGAVADDDLILVGNSIGGLVAVVLAHRLSPSVSGIIASGIPGLGDEINLGLGTKDIVSREFALKIAQKVFFDQSRIIESDIDRIFAEVGTSRSLIQMTRILRFSRRLSVEKLLDNVVHPTLLIWGKEDLVTPPMPWADLPKRNRNFEFHAVELAGHCPMIETPARFNSLAARFLERVPLKARSIASTRSFLDQKLTGS